MIRTLNIWTMCIDEWNLCIFSHTSWFSFPVNKTLVYTSTMYSFSVVPVVSEAQEVRALAQNNDPEVTHHWVWLQWVCPVYTGLISSILSPTKIVFSSQIWWLWFILLSMLPETVQRTCAIIFYMPTYHVLFFNWVHFLALIMKC